MELIKTFPSVVKYMGSKTEVLDLIEKGINYLGRDYDCICDLFAGSATLSAALRNKAYVVSNDIQTYSGVFANTYLNNYVWDSYPEINEICNRASQRVERFNEHFSEYRGKFSYDKDFSLEELNQMEEEQRALVEVEHWKDFDQYYLFVKNYSGTYWSYDQCIWIDSYRAIIDEYINDVQLYNLLLTCLIYAMAYNSQSTGHYAQYRVPENDSSKDDILIYRRKSITEFFVRKYAELKCHLQNENQYGFETTALKDTECLQRLPERSLVYADPPYCFVHYSRFYHILETVVKYDYPEVKYKGRYRNDRYQSDYCKKTEVEKAFCKLVDKVRERHSDLVLSYTNSETNTIAFENLLEIFCKHFNPEQCNDQLLKIAQQRGESFFKDDKADVVQVLALDDFEGLNYEIAMIKKPYNHSRMGRKDTKTIPVTEVVIVAKYLQ